MGNSPEAASLFLSVTSQSLSGGSVSLSVIYNSLSTRFCIAVMCLYKQPAPPTPQPPNGQEKKKKTKSADNAT